MVKRLRYQPIIKIKGRIEVVSSGPFFKSKVRASSIMISEIKCYIEPI